MTTLIVLRQAQDERVGLRLLAKQRRFGRIVKHTLCVFFFSLMNTRNVFYEKAKKGNIISSLSRYKEAKIIRLHNLLKIFVLKLKSFKWTAERFSRFNTRFS